MQTPGHRRALLLICWMILLLVSGGRSALILALPRLDRAQVPAAGRRRVLLTVEEFGRYAITVQSAQGVSLRLVDRMSGPGPIAGSAGESDGRVDAFLERGDYLVLTEGDPASEGKAALEVHPYAEANGDPLSELLEGRLIGASLRDLERRSYWIHLDNRRSVVLEAAGRNLSDLRLWRDGSWLVDVAPQMEVRQPEEGRPLKVLNISTVLEPGFYLVAAYGGPELSWARDDNSNPLYLRYGIPFLGRGGRRQCLVSPFGFDRYRVSSSSNYFRIALPQAGAAVLKIGAYSPDTPFDLIRAAARIEKNTVPPAAEIAANAEFVMVESQAGQPYVLQHFEQRPYYQFQARGTSWVSSIQTGDARDSFDATGLLLEEPEPGGNAGHIVPVAGRAVTLDSKTTYRRTANLLDRVTLILDVKTPGRYQVRLEGTDAEATIEPLLVTRPGGYQSPGFQKGDSIWDLGAGLHVLTIRPETKGILTLTVRPQSIMDSVLGYLGLGDEITQARPAAWICFPRLELKAGRHYRLILGQLPGVRAGLELRRVPVELDQPLPVYLPPGEALTVPIRIREEGVLSAAAEDGSRLPLWIDAQESPPSARLSVGSYQVEIRSSGEQGTWANLKFEPVRLLSETPLPKPDLGLLPDFPVLTSGQPLYVDLDRSQKATFRLEASRPGLYRLQSTGLLATEGNVRSRTEPSFSRASQNGVGRNFSIHQYLREGSYQLTLDTLGRSKGHLGVEATLSQAVSGGDLTEGIPARISLPADRAVSYGFQIGEAGMYRLRVIALNRQFRCRLEDDEGWPLLPPGGPADIRRRFEPGRYRILVLPEVTPARALTLLEREPAPVKLEGHGPHELELNEPAENVWLETAGEAAPRKPDVWTIHLPASVTATIHLTGEMEGRLYRTSQTAIESRSEAAFVPPGRSWRGSLEEGDYTLEAVCSRRNNRVPYEVVIRPDELVAGLSRSVSVPADLPLSVGTGSWIELFSLGTSDVKATVYGADDVPLASNDDRPNDWNFLISERLPPGRFRLRVEPVGSRTGSCRVFMRAPTETRETALEPGRSRSIRIGTSATVVPLVAPNQSAFVSVEAESPVNVELVLERRSGGGWVRMADSRGTRTGILANLNFVENRAESQVQLRVNPIDQRDADVRIGLREIAPNELAESRLAAGIRIRGSDSEGGSEILLIRLDRPGLFQVEGGRDVLWTSLPGTAFRHSEGEPIAASGNFLALALPEGSETVPLKVRRIVLGSGDVSSQQFQLQPGIPAACDLEPGSGSVLVKVSAETGQPGVSIVDENEPREPSATGMAAGEDSAIAVHLHAGGRQALIWTAGPEKVPYQTRIETLSYAAPPLHPVDWLADVQIESQSAAALSLPVGLKRVRLAMEENLVAVLSSSDRVESVYWASRTSDSWTLETAASELTLFQTASHTGHVSLRITPLYEEPTRQVLNSSSPFEGRFLAAGLLELRIAGQSVMGSVLRISGSSGPAVMVSDSGKIFRGNRIPIGRESGRVLVPHGLDPLVCWLESPGEEGQALWKGDSATAAKPIAVPSLVPLSGNEAAFVVELPEPTVLHLETPVPVLARLKVATNEAEVTIHPHGLARSVYCPAGHVDLRLRPFAGGALTSQLELRSSPALPIGEGLGPEILLAPGSSTYFTFVIDREADIGLGVRAGSDVVEAELYSVGGKLLGKGTVLMPHLKPGAYLLALRNPASARPVAARPALVGLETPGTSPPEEIIRHYIETGDFQPESTEEVPPELRGPQ